MSARAKLALGVSALLLLGAAAVLGAGWVVRTREASVAPAPDSRVPGSWREFREGTGHLVHVQQEGLSCESCHGAGQNAAPSDFVAPSMQVCAGCHEDAASIQHAVSAVRTDAGAAHPIAADAADAAAQTAGHALSNCLSCHGFGPQTEPAWRCIRCHEQPQGEVHAVPTDGHQECGLCHKPHAEPAIAPAVCKDCHATSDNTHAGISAEGSDNCLGCHDAHASATQATARCTTCHQDKPDALFTMENGAGHDRCTGCHAPHAFSRSQVASCRSCHTQQPVLAEKTAKAHAQCSSCHDPHAPTQASEASCLKCHTKVAPQHPKVEGQQCIGCHAPHGKGVASMVGRPINAHGGVQHRSTKGAPSAQACTSCHTQLGSGSDRGAHAGKADCVSCHAPHAFSKPTQARACVSCHAEEIHATQAVAKAGHASCLGCHQGHPHDAKLPPTQCTTCHSKVRPRPEHQQCSTCHTPHDGGTLASSTSCKSCHQRQHASVAPIEKHRECRTCHTPHEGKPLAAAQCKSCHAPKAAQNHGQLAQGCTSCHGIHDQAGVLATPSCQSCHTPQKLPGLHKSPKHQECAKCHDGAHDKGPFSERATCTQCHTDRQNHVPEAKLCQGCHVFRR